MSGYTPEMAKKLESGLSEAEAALRGIEAVVTMAIEYIEARAHPDPVVTQALRGVQALADLAAGNAELAFR